MSVDNVKTLDDWRQNVLTGWNDHRIVDALWVDVHIWFFEHLYADLANFGLSMDGFTLREKGGYWLLVLKLLGEGPPQVAFVSASTPTDCMRKTRKLLRNGGLNLTPDQFR